MPGEAFVEEAEEPAFGRKERYCQKQQAEKRLFEVTCEPHSESTEVDYSIEQLLSNAMAINLDKLALQS
jgi:hypothetical protein